MIMSVEQNGSRLADKAVLINVTHRDGFVSLAVTDGLSVLAHTPSLTPGVLNK